MQGYKKSGLLEASVPVPTLFYKWVPVPLTTGTGTTNYWYWYHLVSVHGYRYPLSVLVPVDPTRSTGRHDSLLNERKNVG